MLFTSNLLIEAIGKMCNAAILIRGAGGARNWLKPELGGFGVPALAGGAVARSSALKFFEVILFASAPPPEGGTPNLQTAATGKRSKNTQAVGGFGNSKSSAA